MKRLAKYGLHDIAIKNDKQLLILVCDTPKHANELFQFLKHSDYHWDYRSGDDYFKLIVYIMHSGNESISITPGHPCFQLTNDSKLKNIREFTTGALLANNELRYLDDRCPFPHFNSGLTNARKINDAASRHELGFWIGGIDKIQEAFRSMFSSKSS